MKDKGYLQNEFQNNSTSQNQNVQEKNQSFEQQTVQTPAGPAPDYHLPNAPGTSGMGAPPGYGTPNVYKQNETQQEQKQNEDFFKKGELKKEFEKTQIQQDQRAAQEEGQEEEYGYGH